MVLDSKQRKAIFAQIEEKKRILAAQIAATKKISEWEIKKE